MAWIVSTASLAAEPDVGERSAGTLLGCAREKDLEIELGRAGAGRGVVGWDPFAS